MSVFAWIPLVSEIKASQVYEEQHGVVVMQFESAPAVDNWILETKHEGYSGTGYYTWRGDDHFQKPGPGRLTYKFLIHNPGTYHLRLRSLHIHDDTSQENDVWTRMDGGEWKKTFATPNKKWTWMTKHDFGGYKPWVSYILGKGVHVLEFSGRSKNFSIDLIHLYKDGVYWIEDHTLPTSPKLHRDNYNYAPCPDAGPEKNLTMPQNSTILMGSAEDIDGTIVAYEWKKVNGPSVEMHHKNTQQLQLTELKPGEYVFQLKTTDNDGGTGYDEAKVTVYPGSQVSMVNEVFELTDGQVMFEVEQVDLKDEWKLEQENEGYSGQGYVVWRGKNLFDEPHMGCQLAYQIKIDKDGDYSFRVHNRHDHPLSDQENDNWVRFDDGQWFKFYSSQKQVWTWQTGFIDFDGFWPLTAGTHTIYIAPRSFGYKIDRIQVFRKGTLQQNVVTRTD